MTTFWIIVAIVVIGVIWYAMAKKKKGESLPRKPEGPTTPPPETPAM